MTSKDYSINDVCSGKSRRPPKAIFLEVHTVRLFYGRPEFLNIPDSNPDPGSNTVADTLASPDPDPEPDPTPDNDANTVTHIEPDHISDSKPALDTNTATVIVANPKPD